MAHTLKAVSLNRPSIEQLEGDTGPDMGSSVGANSDKSCLKI